jgi:hypothetical protein
MEREDKPMKLQPYYQPGDKIGGHYSIQQALMATFARGSMASGKHPSIPLRENVIEIEAYSLPEARGLMDFQMPEGFHLISERVISDGRPKTAKGVADTTEAAFAKVQHEIPGNAIILEKKVLTTPKQKIITIKAFDEQSAESRARFQAGSQLGDTGIVKHIKLIVIGSKGLLGLRKKPNQYEAELWRQALVEIKYKPKVKVSIRIGRELSPKEQQ